MNSVIKISVVLNQPVMKQSSGSTDNWMTMPVVTLISGKQMRFVIYQNNEILRSSTSNFLCRPGDLMKIEYFLRPCVLFCLTHYSSLDVCYTCSLFENSSFEMNSRPATVKTDKMHSTEMITISRLMTFGNLGEGLLSTTGLSMKSLTG